MSNIYQRYTNNSPQNGQPPLRDAKAVPPSKAASLQPRVSMGGGTPNRQGSKQGGVYPQQSNGHIPPPQNYTNPQQSPRVRQQNNYTSVQPPASKQQSSGKSTPPPPRQKHNHRHKAHGVEGILGKLLPSSLYNPDTKKILGFLSAEDLLLVALIFLFLDSDEEDSRLLVLALAFVLLSDYIDLSGFNL